MLSVFGVCLLFYAFLFFLFFILSLSLSLFSINIVSIFLKIYITRKFPRIVLFVTRTTMTEKGKQIHDEETGGIDIEK